MGASIPGASPGCWGGGVVQCRLKRDLHVVGIVHRGADDAEDLDALHAIPSQVGDGSVCARDFLLDLLLEIGDD